VDIDYIIDGKAEEVAKLEIVLPKILKLIKIDGKYIINVTVVDDKTIQVLNKHYRGKDSPTDVLTFALDEGTSIKEPAIPKLIDIYIDYEQVFRQAPTSYDSELYLLVIHGILHGLGYDHQDEVSQKEMFDYQEKILKQILEVNKMERLNEKAIKELVSEAIRARLNSYSPYSNFKVGAAVQVKKDGKTIVFLGTNIENAAYGEAVCAERNALFAAYSNGYHKEDIIALAVVADTNNLTSPCGSCRQVISELMDLEAPIILANLKGAIEIKTVKELLPFSFSSNNLTDNE